MPFIERVATKPRPGKALEPELFSADDCTTTEGGLSAKHNPLKTENRAKQIHLGQPRSFVIGNQLFSKTIP